MTRLKEIQCLPSGEQVAVYLDLATHFRSMGILAHTDRSKRTFEELAKNMDERAGAVTVFASQTTG